MNERQSDFEWLQQFARAGNQGAFRNLVQRHLDLVFATALHKVGDAGGAEEISQNVFSVLARKAWRFAPDDSLPAWLHKTTLLESKSWLRGELRRRRREETAAELGTTMKTSDDRPAFNALVPLLDDALLSLREKDRTALLVRFYEKQSLREVGAALNVGEDAAQKRVQTALEKLSEFFQRRGYKTATVAAAAAALQQTATSTSAATVSVVASTALKAAPPVLVGLSAWLARLATLSKAQVAAVCLVVVTAPVLWQWSEQHKADAELAQARANLATAQSEFSRLQTETEQLRGRSSRMDTTLADATSSAAQREDRARQFEAWKQRMRGQLLAADYHWPEDSPFVRIPKMILPQLEVFRPVEQPGVIKQEARELMGLTPQEREIAETALQKYFTALDSLMASSRYETNCATFAHVSRSALASEVFGLPALGDAVKQYSDELLASLRADLGEERWPLMESQLASSGTDTLRRILDLDAGERSQELAVWIDELNGQLVAGYSWAITLLRLVPADWP
jgi:RNA polymerase sigma factor (sigma-70 family)